MQKFEIINNHDRLRVEISEYGFYIGVNQDMNVCYIKLTAEQINELKDFLNSVGK